MYSETETLAIVFANWMIFIASASVFAIVKRTGRVRNHCLFSLFSVQANITRLSLSLFIKWDHLLLSKECHWTSIGDSIINLSVFQCECAVVATYVALKPEPFSFPPRYKINLCCTLIVKWIHSHLLFQVHFTNIHDHVQVQYGRAFLRSSSILNTLILVFCDNKPVWFS